MRKMFIEDDDKKYIVLETIYDYKEEGETVVPVVVIIDINNEDDKCVIIKEVAEYYRHLNNSRINPGSVICSFSYIFDDLEKYKF